MKNAKAGELLLSRFGLDGVWMARTARPSPASANNLALTFFGCGR